MHAIVASALVGLLVVEPPVEPAPSHRRAPGRPLQIAGGAAMAAGGGWLVVSGGLLMSANRLANDLAIASSPGPTGVPAVRWRDIQDDYYRLQRIKTATTVTSALGIGFLVVGAGLLVAGTVRRSRGRRALATPGPGGLTLRW